MKFSIAIVLCWTIVLVSGDNLDVSIPPEPSNTTDTSTSTVHPTEKPITTQPTHATTSKLPPAPNTTTVTPPTTQTPPTTSTPASTTFTPASTTVVPPTTPRPAPEPKVGKWIVNGTNETCIVMTMAAQFNLTYLNLQNKTVSVQITLPSDNTTIVSGVCEPSEQVINITWMSPSKMNGDSLIFHFVNQSKTYSLHHILLDLTVDDLPLVRSNNTMRFIHNVTEFSTGLGNSYRCAKLQKIHLNSTLANTTGTLHVSDLQFQAFRHDHTSVFGYAEDCALETQDLVPIAVGCALIVLIVIVLAAYLIGRRRSQARGYLSM